VRGGVGVWVKWAIGQGKSGSQAILDQRSKFRKKLAISIESIEI